MWAGAGASGAAGAAAPPTATRERRASPCARLAWWGHRGGGVLTRQDHHTHNTRGMTLLDTGGGVVSVLKGWGPEAFIDIGRRGGLTVENSRQLPAVQLALGLTGAGPGGEDVAAPGGGRPAEGQHVVQELTRFRARHLSRVT
jgi:hypothetical protein